MNDAKGLQERNLVLAIVLTIVTCGIYGMYWVACINNDTLAACGEQGTSGGMVVLLTIVTCGIYGFVWNYKQGERIGRALGCEGGNMGILYLLLSVFGLSIVSYALQQSELNKIANGQA